ncbi:MAG: NAD-dependent epimerase/dehydratase family protein [Phycisphaerales bacterium]
MRHKNTVLITGSSGLIGSSLVRSLGRSYNVVGIDRAGPPYPPIEAECVGADLTSPESIRRALERVSYAYGNSLAAVVHLAAYYDFSGASSELYETLSVNGTRELLRQLQAFDVGVFVFSSTMLLHAPCRPDQRINEESPLQPKWAYPRSKVEAERVIREEAGGMPALALRIAGVYDDHGRSLPLAHQIRRIDAERLTSRVFPGNTSCGQTFVHLDDTVAAFERAIERRASLRGFMPILIGEGETLSYDELQRTISRLLHGEEIETVEIPKSLARAGAWIREYAPFAEEPFIKPWMVGLADDHYAIDIARAEQVLGWRPRRSLRATLPRIIASLRRDPKEWYAANGLEAPSAAEESGDRVRR